MLILILAANTAYNGFPRLASLLAQDGFLPHQMRVQGDRLAFSNGILILGLCAAILLILFRGNTHALIPLYAVGVFLSFTLSQSGMVRHWQDHRRPGWRKALAINLTGAVATGVATIVLTVTKFTHGAWVVIVLIPLLIVMFRKIRWHYRIADWQLALDMYERPKLPPPNIMVMPISGVNRAVVMALDYARERGQDLRAVYVDLNPDETVKTKQQWSTGARKFRWSFCLLRTDHFWGHCFTTSKASAKVIQADGSPLCYRRWFLPNYGKVFYTISGRS